MPELLSPAGDLSIFKSVIEQGADAVYFAGSLFGARAYAKNFTDDEVLEAIDFAHIYGKKAYLTINTLIKNQEFEKELFDYVAKFYEAGIDAILVQDIGVYYWLKKFFPGISLHVSTQATVSSHYGVLFFKELNADRVVLSRELSIAEIKKIKELTGMELEVFVHGAMCVSYSGKCLMSSMIGGRSGNRGRCAQPCRLNYGTEIDGKLILPAISSNTNNNDKSYSQSSVNTGKNNATFLSKSGVNTGKNNAKISSKSGASGSGRASEKSFTKSENNNAYYPLSMKDLCGLYDIPALIDAGVDSLKIEGRMKSKEYASGVTSVYRDFLDAYAEDKNVINDKKYMKEAMDYLLALGNRGNFSSSYYYNRSSKEMISFKDSSLHTGSVEGTFRGIQPWKNKIDVVFKASLSDGIFLSETLERDRNCTSEYTSDKVFPAEKRAVTKEEIKEKLSEISDTPFEIGEIEINIEDGIFIPMSEIKSLKRAAVKALADHILTECEIKYNNKIEAAKAEKKPFSCYDALNLNLSNPSDDAYDSFGYDTKNNVTEMEYLTSPCPKDKFYFSCLFEYQLKILLASEKVENIIIPASLFLRLQNKKEALANKNIFIDLPSVIRDEDSEHLERIIEETKKFCEESMRVMVPGQAVETVQGMVPGQADESAEKAESVHSAASAHQGIKGYFASSFDALYFLKAHGIKPAQIFLSPEIYSFSDFSEQALENLGYEHQSVPFELNENELKHRHLRDFMMTVYGKTPLMHLQDCIYRNTEGCHKAEFLKNSFSIHGAAMKKNDFHGNKTEFQKNKTNGGMAEIPKRDYSSEKAYYIDRLGKKFFDAEDCMFCQNTLYNTVPTMLFNEMEAIRAMHISDFRIDFTDENESTVNKIIAYIFSLSNEKGYNTKDADFLKNTTRGHFHRGVE